MLYFVAVKAVHEKAGERSSDYLSVSVDTYHEVLNILSLHDDDCKKITPKRFEHGY